MNAKQILIDAFTALKNKKPEWADRLRKHAHDGTPICCEEDAGYYWKNGAG